jgi:hypothetical protein
VILRRLVVAASDSSSKCDFTGYCQLRSRVAMVIPTLVKTVSCVVNSLSGMSFCSSTSSVSVMNWTQFRHLCSCQAVSSNLQIIYTKVQAYCGIVELTLSLRKLIQTLDLITNAALELNRLAPNAGATLGDTSTVKRTSTPGDNPVTQVLELPLGEHALHADLFAVDAFDPVVEGR